MDPVQTHLNALGLGGHETASRAEYRLAAAVLISLTTLWSALGHRQRALDFAPFYVAGHVEFCSLYDPDRVNELGRQLLASDGIEYVPPYVRPAVFALPFRALAQLPYWPAYWTWAGLNLGFLLASLILLDRMFPVPGPDLLCFALFLPATFGITTGQDSPAVLLALTVALTALDRGKQVVAGCLLALCLYKFNLMLLVPVLLIVKRQWRCLAAFAVGGAVLAAVSAALAPAGDYVRLLTEIPSHLSGFSATRMISMRGLAEATGLPWIYLPLALMACAVCVWLFLRLPMAPAFAVALLGSLLCAYQANGYDGTLAAIPIMVALHQGGVWASVWGVATIFLLGRPPLPASPVVLAVGLGAASHEWSRE